jgi:hypothetical protein
MVSCQQQMDFYHNVSAPARFEEPNSQREDSIVATDTGRIYHSHTIAKGC